MEGDQKGGGSGEGGISQNQQIQPWKFSCIRHPKGFWFIESYSVLCWSSFPSNTDQPVTVSLKHVSLNGEEPLSLILDLVSQRKRKGVGCLSSLVFSRCSFPLLELGPWTGTQVVLTVGSMTYKTDLHLRFWSNSPSRDAGTSRPQVPLADLESDEQSQRPLDLSLFRLSRFDPPDSTLH